MMKKTDGKNASLQFSAAGHARIGRPARISLEDIARTALHIGFEEVTMISVGQALGVDHSSLYRYVKGRKELLLAAADMAIAQAQWKQDAPDWRTYGESVAETAWSLFEDHPGLAVAIREMGVTPASGIRGFAQTANRFIEYGFAAEEAVLLIDCIFDMTVDYFTGWPRMSQHQAIGGCDLQNVVKSWQAEADRNQDHARPINIMTRIMAEQPKEWWNKKIGMILDGGEALYARRQAIYEAAE